MQHTGDADEVAGLIIKSLVSSQRLENRDAHRRKQAVCADNDKNYGEKIHAECVKRILRCHGDVIARAEGADAQQREQPFRLRLALPCVLAVQQLDGALKMEPLEVTQQRHGNDSGKGRRGQADRLTRDIKLKHRVKAHNAPDQHHHELLKQYAERDADDDAAQPCVQ